MTDDSRAHSCPHEVPSHSPSYPRYMLSFCFGYFVILTNLLTLLFCDQNSRGHRTGRADSRSVLSLRSSAALSSLRDRQSCCRAPREPAECAAEQAWPRPPHRHHSVVGPWLAGGGPCRGWERLGEAAFPCDLSAGPPRPWQRPCPGVLAYTCVFAGARLGAR